MEHPWKSLTHAYGNLSPARRKLVAAAGGLLAILLLVLASSRQESRIAGKQASLNTGGIGTLPIDRGDSPFANEKLVATPPLHSYGLRPGEASSVPGQPEITYSAELAVVTREFNRARSSLEEILERHRGYTAKLRMVGQPSGSTLAANLRVQASEYAAAVAELKSVGNVERDEEAADEVVQRRSDLVARLQNAQNAERRLQELLKDESGKAGRTMDLGRQIAQVHGEIERMETEQHAWDDRAVFSNIYFSLREEHVTPAENFSAQLRTTTLNGLSDAFKTISAILLFCVSYGPSLLLWVALLFVPARMIWRRSRTTLVRDAA